ncbi:MULTISPECIES: glutamyl-tRNA reductase [Spongiibacter]|jgi:glutamyl-tRNA reductase|uniref:glutamyl-tRNA reductase n=1 Tax=Spongiibacter TaxID=630749 RepID=UPI000C0B2114|nr:MULTISPECIES: glutamyl-tRNA reductase [unclassified Spongiibacter]MAK44803.1 glutamyl-tRNA reductase [Spongiibacter sp.]|tara:strand:+ start:2216 stop:3493 length:1278 start_codon:yes stop_codon:yes gene_type:complete
MKLLLVGINHNSAPLSVRERVAFVPEQIHLALQDALACGLGEELAILSTCNRTEIYALGGQGDAVDDAKMLDWLSRFHHVERSHLDDCCYISRDSQALQHMMEVAAGLDSMVLGEPQILGQMKSAYALAAEAGTAASGMHQLFSQVFSVAKQVRTDTAIGENPVSVAYAAVSLTQHVFSKLSKCTALLIGAGETIELVARHLREKGVKRIIIANRTLERARQLGEEFQAEAVMLSDIPAYLRDADILVASTASQLPILGKGAVEVALKKRKHRPMVMVDIAVPRDIEPQVAELDDVYLYTVDDLREIVDENKRARESEARKADQLIVAAIEEWQARLRSRGAVATVKDFRAKAEGLRDAELERARRQLAKGEDAAVVLEQLARGLTNKLIHSPTTQIKEAGAKGRNDLVDWARELLQLRDQDREN